MRDLTVGLCVVAIVAACLVGPGIALSYTMGWLGPDSQQLRAALTDFARTNEELRASSAKLRERCEGPPRVQPANREFF